MNVIFTFQCISITWLGHCLNSKCECREWVDHHLISNVNVGCEIRTAITATDPNRNRPDSDQESWTTTKGLNLQEVSANYLEMLHRACSSMTSCW